MSPPGAPIMEACGCSTRVEGHARPTSRQAGAPFTAQEVHQLAFGLPEQWLGVINRDRWRAHGAVVMDEWASRVRAEQELFERESAEQDLGERVPPSRPQPWPVTFYGQPVPSGK